MRVVVVDANFPDLNAERTAAQQAGASFHFADTSDPVRIAEAVSGASVALVQFAPFGRSALERLAPGARVIRYGVGYDNIDLHAARDLGVDVAYIPDYCTDEVADHTVSLMLCLLRKIISSDQQVRKGRWSAIEACAPLQPFSKTVVGFLGFGRIAQAVRDRLRPFGFRFLFHDPVVEQRLSAGSDATPVGIDELIAQSDALSLHLPSAPETRHIIDATRLAAIKPGSIIVNTARGDLIDTAALADALEKGRLSGAALDVFESEPLAPDHPIRAAENAILTPHSAWYSDESISTLQRLAADEIGRALTGQAARRPVPYQMARSA